MEACTHAPEPERQVMIVDDNAETREALGDLIGALGYRVVAAADGLEALNYLRDHEPPEMILCDLTMPRMNGWVFRMEQQRDPRLARVPVVMVSGVHDAASAADYLNAADYLEKPIDPERLVDLLHRLIN